MVEIVNTLVLNLPHPELESDLYLTLWPLVSLRQTLVVRLYHKTSSVGRVTFVPVSYPLLEHRGISTNNISASPHHNLEIEMK